MLLLKRYVLTGIRDGPHEPFIADSVDFVVSQVTFVLHYLMLISNMLFAPFSLQEFVLFLDNKEFPPYFRLGTS